MRNCFDHAGTRSNAGLLKSLDELDRKLDDIWADEAERRLVAYREGRLKGIPMEEIFGDKVVHAFGLELGVRKQLRHS